MGKRIRVIIQQPALPHYRVPVFRELASRPGIDLTVLYGSEANLENAKPDGFRAEAEPASRLPGSLYWSPAAIRAVKEADVAVLSWNLRYLSLPPALLFKRSRQVSVLLWGHGYSLRTGRFRSAARLRLCRYADGCVLYSHRCAEVLAARGIPASKLHVAQNTLDERIIERARRRWQERHSELAAFRLRHQLADGPVILFVSRLNAATRVDQLLMAVATIRRELPGTRVIIIGDGPARPALEKLRATLSLQTSVTFVGSVYDEEQLAPWFMSATVFCYPEAIGLSAIHALWYGLPVIAANSWQCHGPEFAALRDGYNALLFRRGDVPGLARQLHRVATSPTLRQRLAENALRSVRDNYTLTTMIDGFWLAIQHTYCSHVLDAQDACGVADR